MKRLFQTTGLLSAILWLTSCASTPTRLDTGAIKAHTFNFIQSTGKSDSAIVENRPEVHAMIQHAIAKNLLAKGLTQVAASGDIAVYYLIILSDGTRTETVNDFFGYGDSYDLQDKAHEAFAVEKKNRTGFAAGTLVIDIVDVKRRLILNRNFAWRPVMPDLPAAERQTRIQGAVDEVLKGLSISQ